MHREKYAENSELARRNATLDSVRRQKHRVSRRCAEVERADDKSTETRHKTKSKYIRST